MAYAILRVAKLKTMGNVGGQSSHVERLRETLNADPARLALNQRLAGTDSPVHDVQERLTSAGIQPRKGAVLAIDVFISASPEHFARNHPDDPNWKAFQQRAMAFLRQEYGANNVVHAIAHHDETSPHLHAIIVPIKTKTVKVGRQVKTERQENRLCARDWLGGDRSTLSKLQTRFANSVKELGLARGIEGSQAKHTQVSQFYSLMKETTSQAQAIHKALAPVEADYFVRSVPKPGLLEVAQPRKFAQAQVQHALSSMADLIKQTNHNAEIARRGQLVSLQTPATDALLQKGQSRQSQAEQALKQLGYRLDQHGQLVNLLEERKNALRATISHSLSKSVTPRESSADLASKGIRMSFHQEHTESYGGKSYHGACFDDGQGRVWGHELGADFTTGRLVEQLAARQAQREKLEREKAYRASFDKALAELFELYKGDAGRVAHYLGQSVAGDRAIRERTLTQFTHLHGAEGASYARERFERLDKMKDFQLVAERDALQKAGYEVGLGKGQRLGR